MNRAASKIAKEVPYRLFSKLTPSWSIQTLLPDKNNAIPTITNAQIEKLCELSLLKPPSPQQTERLSRDVGNILSCVKAIQQVDTTGVSPLRSLVEDSSLPLREDEGRETLSSEEILSYSKHTHGHFFVVPKVKDDDEN
eukprot:TRINITY_DN12590_c0_g1_i1.p1 TRINITY_DN12590_c0_g1~~TRINITY_DN12590_c0_g1_i1.p1  ORF type:complete len:139 (-),score=32.53 TRINITY_DN12590_c0_g1_i1:264-680(-)